MNMKTCHGTEGVKPAPVNLSINPFHTRTHFYLEIRPFH
ncbi:hypothetical protein E2C01_038762 [Portunus trituberculatus]|uniref:Uncharacterized protein n=1 Tax=Portunus trituberculatus TaxID=210409 RepID=A0A5B7FHT2_PORTR|nr:hypothetical protein [Portunus trituberculatus]